MGKPIPWTTQEIREATKGNILCGDMNSIFSGISINSRKINDNEIFVAIRGNLHDGHNFINDVIDHGISGVVVDQSKSDTLLIDKWGKKRIVCVAVSDTTHALGDLANYQRKRSHASVIAITGSNGKTTTREMTSAVVSQKFNTLSTERNFNNEIGLPLTLFNLSKEHKWAVVELGMNRPGEIKRLGQICMPDVGVITNIGPAHLEGVGSMEGVMNAKGELLDQIKPGGTAVLNADDHRVLHLAGKASRDVLLFGFSQKADIRATSLKRNGMGSSFTLQLPSKSIAVKLPLPGDFMISNALAAAGVGYQLGLTPEKIKAGLESFKPVQGRMNIHKTKKGINIIDDTYNANPGSMEAAISTLKSLQGKMRGLLVTGDMFELGNHAEQMHNRLGSLTAKSHIKKLFVTGKHAKDVEKGAIAEHMDARDIFCGQKEEIIDELKEILKPGDWILVKGSRAMGMEMIIKELMNWDAC